MNRYFYDLHIHSCLSPCADDDMTPANIAGMAHLCGLNIVALTDHNTTKNCPAFFCECKKLGIIPVAGCELTTAEDIHIICLFASLDSAVEFDKSLQPHRVRVANRPEIFGNQLIMGPDDQPIGTEPDLLINAVDLSIDVACDFARGFGAAVYPAHIDRESNGIVSALGTFPESPFFAAAEYNLAENEAKYKQKYSILRQKQTVVSSDAHQLYAINEAENSFVLHDEPYSGAMVTKSLLALLSGEEQ